MPQAEGRRDEERRRIYTLWTILTATAVCGSFLLTWLALSILSQLQL